MKVGIITFHRADNYGAMLQTLALMNVIKQMEYNVDIIDYRCPAIENFYKCRYLPHFHYNPLGYIREFFYNLKWTPILKRKSHKCEIFRKNYYKMSKSVFSDNDRLEIENNYSLILTGSDQIWKTSITHGKDDWYAFKKKSESAIIASYAASVGSLSVFRQYYKIYESDLKKYDFISVREQNLQSFLSQKLNKDIFIVADPTLVVDSKLWYEVTKNISKRKKSYILYYDVDYNNEASKIVQNIAVEKGLDVVYFKKMPYGKYKSFNVADSDPIEFLSLIRNADYVVTSSFHATVFSIIFKKQFVTVLHPRTGDRLKSLLNSLYLNTRLYETSCQFDINRIDDQIDWQKIDDYLKDLQDSSKNYLTLCLENMRNKE